MLATTERPRGTVAPWTPLEAIIVGGLIAGACDMAYALIYFSGVLGAPAIRIPQSIAAGLLGRAAFAGGVATATLGVALHWFNALTMAAVYVYVGRRFLPVILRKPVLYGALYGAMCYFVMNYIVIPLSAISPKPHYVPLTWWSGLAVHMFAIGLAISLSASKTLPQR